MNIDTSDISELARRLGRAIEDTPDPKVLTHSGYLHLLARANRFENYQTWRAQLARTWCYRQHEPFLPNELHVVSSLSTRKAVWRDTTEQAVTDEALAQVVASMQRMLWQVNQVRHGSLRVEFELQSALSAATAQPLDELEQRVRGAERNADDFLQDFGRKPMSVTNAERYQNLYLSWRLATLSLALRRFIEMPQRNHLLDLVADHIDLYGFVALNLKGELKPGAPLPAGDTLAQLAHEVRRTTPETRICAKAVTLEYLSGSDVGYATLNGTLHLPQWGLTHVDGYDMVQALFPEVALWHAWVELKPLLAREADAFYKTRAL